MRLEKYTKIDKLPCGITLLCRVFNCLPTHEEKKEEKLINFLKNLPSTIKDKTLDIKLQYNKSPCLRTSLTPLPWSLNWLNQFHAVGKGLDLPSEVENTKKRAPSPIPMGDYKIIEENMKIQMKIPCIFAAQQQILLN